MITMDYQELHLQLKSLQAQKAAVEKALHAKRADRKKQLIAEFKARLAEEGFDFEALCGADAKKRSKGSTDRTYPSFVAKDDAECVYTRGPIPGWMKEKMSALGLNPKAKEDRERFKSDYMVFQE